MPTAATATAAMAGKKDPRKKIGATVWAKAEHVTRDLKRIHGLNYKTLWVSGTVTKVDKRLGFENAKRMTSFITSSYQVGEVLGEPNMKEYEISLQNLKANDPRLSTATATLPAEATATLPAPSAVRVETVVEETPLPPLLQPPTPTTEVDEGELADLDEVLPAAVGAGRRDLPGEGVLADPPGEPEHPAEEARAARCPSYTSPSPRD